MVEKVIIKNPSVLIKLFPLYERHYILHDADGGIWIFTEKLHNGIYPKYTLSGKTVGNGFTFTAKLFSKFLCSENNVSIFMEDIFTNKKEKGIGSWMMNRFIELTRAIDRAVAVNNIYGHLIEDEERAKKEGFFKRFGFTAKRDPHNRLLVTAQIEELHMIPIQNAKEISIEQIINEWIELKT